MTPREDWNALRVQVAEGSGSAVVDLLDRLKGLCARLAGGGESEDEAHGLLQRIWVAIRKSEARGTVIEDFRAFCVTCILNRMRSRRAAPMLVPLDPAEPDDVAASTGPDAAEEVGGRLVRGVVRRRLEGLPPLQRDVVRMYYIHGLRIREIARVFAAEGAPRSPEAIEACLRRARTRLRRELRGLAREVGETP